MNDDATKSARLTGGGTAVAVVLLALGLGYPLSTVVAAYGWGRGWISSDASLRLSAPLWWSALGEHPGSIGSASREVWWTAYNAGYRHR